jgi:hypothetical protein
MDGFPALKPCLAAVETPWTDELGKGTEGNDDR